MPHILDLPAQDTRYSDSRTFQYVIDPRHRFALRSRGQAAAPASVRAPDCHHASTIGIAAEPGERWGQMNCVVYRSCRVILGWALSAA